MAFVIGLQASLAGFAVCSDGGCCHAETGPAHVERDGVEITWGEHACGDDHPDHAHSLHSAHPSLVGADRPHRCDCTDQEFAVQNAMRGNRDDLPAVGLTLLPPVALAAIPMHVLAAWPPVAQAARPIARDDHARLQQLAIVRTSRLLL